MHLAKNHSKFKVLYVFLFFLLRRPLKMFKFIFKSTFHQIKTIVDNPKQIESLTDTEKYETTQNSLSIIIFNDRSVGYKSHDLPAPLIVSLTSYALRFSTLPLTLKCLLSQTMKPDKILLWIAHEDKQYLTNDILKLQEVGLEIGYYQNIGPFTKIIPTLEAYPDHFIVTADDDAYYWPVWLEEMVLTWNGNINNIIAHRVHKIRLNENDLPIEYNKWDFDSFNTQMTSPLNFATGLAGVFYPPGTFHPDVLKRDMFLQLCPKADDVWLYWMSRLNGSMVRRTNTHNKTIPWPLSQKSNLFSENVKNKSNDKYIKAMIYEYGFFYEHKL